VTNHDGAAGDGVSPRKAFVVRHFRLSQIDKFDGDISGLDEFESLVPAITDSLKQLRKNIQD
jgi:hypothetical protein